MKNLILFCLSLFTISLAVADEHMNCAERISQDRAQECVRHHIWGGGSRTIQCIQNHNIGCCYSKINGGTLSEYKLTNKCNQATTPTPYNYECVRVSHYLSRISYDWKFISEGESEAINGQCITTSALDYSCRVAVDVNNRRYACKESTLGQIVRYYH